jgi:CDP-diacylglycerol---glycerol-3-phosphate 3-phosphatidyltransferase
MKFSIYQLKPKFQQLLSPLLSLLISLKITPNQITLFTMSLCLLFGAALAFISHMRWLWIVFPLFMLLRMALNAIDGMLANVSNKKTALGALLNELCDQVSDAALYLPFAFLPGIHVPILVVTVIMALLAEFVGVTAVLIGVARRFDGPMGKSDRAFCFSILAILSAINLPSIWLNGILIVMLALLLLTIINRLSQALRLSASIVPPTP